MSSPSLSATPLEPRWTCRKSRVSTASGWPSASSRVSAPWSSFAHNCGQAPGQQGTGTGAAWASPCMSPLSRNLVHPQLPQEASTVVRRISPGQVQSCGIDFAGVLGGSYSWLQHPLLRKQGTFLGVVVSISSETWTTDQFGYDGEFYNLW